MIAETLQYTPIAEVPRGCAAMEILRPAGENAGLQDDATGLLPEPRRREWREVVCRRNASD